MVLRVLSTRRGLRLFVTNSSVAFVAISGLVQLVITLYPLSILQGGRALVAVVVSSAVCGVVQSWPKNAIDREFENPAFKVAVKQGNLFDENSHLVIGFTDTFDTDTNDIDIISPQSIQGQFLRAVYSGNVGDLDRDLASALNGREVQCVEPRANKIKGKLVRYPIGTIAVLGSVDVRYYCVAYSQMSNNLVARSNVDTLWQSLGLLWDELDDSGHCGRVSIPIIGSDLARVDNLDHESIAKMVILSFVARSRKSLISRELTLVIHPRDRARINMNEVAAFLNSL